MADFRQRFTFERFPIRGEIVQVSTVYQRILSQHAYPPLLRRWLGEMVAAIALLGATIKFDGKLIIQVQGQGPVRLLVGESDAQGGIRAYARWNPEAEPTLAASANDLRTCFQEGLMVITIDPGPEMERYQGIVQLEATLAASLEHYFEQSEQLPTRIWLSAGADSGQAGGFLLQRLPGPAGFEDDWRRVGLLAGTLADEELRDIPSKILLHRLYHEDDLRLFNPEPLYFTCHCSRERVENMLRSLGMSELEQILAQEGKVDVACEYCQTRYLFDAVDIADMLAEKHARVNRPEQLQ